MNKINRDAMFQRIVTAVSATLTMIALAGPVRADHIEEGLGILLGGIVGGTIGSAIGNGNGQRVAIGVGSALGALYGGEVATHHRPSRKAHYAHPKHSNSPVVVKYYPQTVPVPVYVQPAPEYFTSSRAAEIAINVSSSDRSSTARHAPASITECRLLEGGLAPVYGCRDIHGGWRILH